MTVAVRALTNARAAAIERLRRAPRVRAKHGVSIGGRTFGATTTTAGLTGVANDPALGPIQVTVQSPGLR